MENIPIESIDLILLELESGIVSIKLRPDLAPNHVQQILKLTREKFYDGLVFHRVIDGFMAQTGCPLGDGTGNCGYTIPAEFTDTPHVRGTCSMARSTEPNSASSQFFICFATTPDLDGEYTVWGEVVSGMDLIDNIKRGDQMAGGIVDNPDKLISMKVVHDTPINIVR